MEGRCNIGKYTSTKQQEASVLTLLGSVTPSRLPLDIDSTRMPPYFQVSIKQRRSAPTTKVLQLLPASRTQLVEKVLPMPKCRNLDLDRRLVPVQEQ